MAWPGQVRGQSEQSAVKPQSAGAMAAHHGPQQPSGLADLPLRVAGSDGWDSQDGGLLAQQDAGLIDVAAIRLMLNRIVPN